MPKDAILPDIAKWFQGQGITCLLCDPRGIGASDGEPRNDVSSAIPASSLAGGRSLNRLPARRSMQDSRLNTSTMP